MPGRDAPGALTSIAAKTVIAAVLLLVFLYAYWHASIPGYLHGLDLCAKGCHRTEVLAPEKITHPWWCVGCHGFGVKSTILPGIPLHRDPQLEMAVEKYGECLMCHSVSDRLHQWHMKAKGEVVRCTDCHTKAYSGGHTTLPGNKVCIRCHDAEKLHTALVNKRLIANCLACHGPSPVADAAELKKEAASYDAVASLGTVLASEVGPRNVTGCRACHNEPDNVGHLKHMGKALKLAPGVERNVTCTDCHLGSLLHGASVPVYTCSQCHHPEEARFHDKGWETLLSSCSRCHRGFRSNATSLVPGKGCAACHHHSYIDVAMVGLHDKHLRPYGYNCTICHSAKARTHKEFIDSVRDDVNKLCRRCHTDTGGLKQEAYKDLRVTISVEPDPMHARLVEKAKGDCVSCHDQWRIAVKPKLYYYYNATETR